MNTGPGYPAPKEPSRTKTPWTDAELLATVEVYKELREGKRQNKASAYRELGQRFNRKPEAYERRMQNISSVLQELRAEWLPGLKPLPNIGANVRPRLVEMVRAVFGSALETGHSPFEPDVVELMKRDLLEVPAGQVEPQPIARSVKDYARDAAVKAWVLKHANGVCECCANPAPFVMSNRLPFLEVHHVNRLAEAGQDTIENTVAVCPNGHRRLHHGADAADLRERLYASIPRLRRRKA
jgi:5-methylcytosine-specific restriction enzyme A